MSLTHAQAMQAQRAEADARHRAAAAEAAKRRAELDRQAALFSAAIAGGNRTLTRRALRLLWELS